MRVRIRQFRGIDYDYVGLLDLKPAEIHVRATFVRYGITQVYAAFEESIQIDVKQVIHTEE